MDDRPRGTMKDPTCALCHHAVTVALVIIGSEKLFEEDHMSVVVDGLFDCSLIHAFKLGIRMLGTIVNPGGLPACYL
jgi:hypothetical protein